MTRTEKVDPQRVGGTLADLTHEMMNHRDFRLGWKLYDLAVELGQVVVAMRKQAGLTQIQLAERLRIGQPAIARLESAHPDRMPTFATIARVAKECGYDMEVAFHYRGEQKPKPPAFVLSTTDTLR
jgi:ribosome-binding protein aMBF1 (putative translation factor)